MRALTLFIISDAMEAGGGGDEGEAHRVKTEVRDALVGIKKAKTASDLRRWGDYQWCMECNVEFF